MNEYNSAGLASILMIVSGALSLCLIYGLISGRAIVQNEYTAVTQNENPISYALEYGLICQLTIIGISLALDIKHPLSPFEINLPLFQALPPAFEIVTITTIGIIGNAILVTLIHKQLCRYINTDQAAQIFKESLVRLSVPLSGLLLIAGTIWTINLHLQGISSYNWPTTKAQNLEFQEEVVNHETKVHAKYNFQYNGKTIKGNHIYLDDFLRPSFSDVCSNKSEEFENSLKETNVLVHFNPKAPEQNCLFPGPDNVFTFLRLLAITIVFAAGLPLASRVKNAVIPRATGVTGYKKKETSPSIPEHSETESPESIKTSQQKRKMDSKKHLRNH